jgi:hypothetical protein
LTPALATLIHHSRLAVMMNGAPLLELVDPAPRKVSVGLDMQFSETPNVLIFALV